MAEHNNNNGRKEVNKVGIIACVLVIVLIAVVVFLVVKLMKNQEPDVADVPRTSEAGEVGSGKIGNTDVDESGPSESSEVAEENVYGENLFVSMDSTEWYFPSATSVSSNAVVTNSELNSCDFYFEVIIDSTQEVVYRSQVLKPGDTLVDIGLGTELESGTYSCSMVHHLVNSDTGVEYDDNVVLGLSITIQ